tara:strand:+ start:603 stop:1016 length:414 start_codon:yes stop_codon:yes gene_type:complete
MTTYAQQIDEEVQSIVVIHDESVESIAVNIDVPVVQAQKTMLECVKKMPACCNATLFVVVVTCVTIIAGMIHISIITSYTVTLVHSIIWISICAIALLITVLCYGCYAHNVYKKYFKEEIDQDKMIQDEEIRTKPAR